MGFSDFFLPLDWQHSRFCAVAPGTTFHPSWLACLTEQNSTFGGWRRGATDKVAIRASGVLVPSAIFLVDCTLVHAFAPSALF